MTNVGDWSTGYRNTGHCNAGHRNAGSRNTGDWNTGFYNPGNYNTGDWNAGDYHVGCFNTCNPEKAYYFNKLINKADWDAAEKPAWIYNTSPTSWVYSEDMTTAEKEAHPGHETNGGYLRENDMKEEWAKAYATATPDDIERTKALPGFDAEVFLEITGIDLRDKPTAATCEGREVEIDGVVYVLAKKEKSDGISVLRGPHRARSRV